MTCKQIYVLLADRDEDTRVILRTALEQHGYSVLEARSARDALELAQQHAISLVILNYPMPLQDGRTLTEQLRAAPETSGIPILNFSSHMLPDTLAHAAAHGVSMTLPKPASLAEVLQMVTQLTAR